MFITVPVCAHTFSYEYLWSFYSYYAKMEEFTRENVGAWCIAIWEFSFRQCFVIVVTWNMGQYDKDEWCRLSYELWILEMIRNSPSRAYVKVYEFNGDTVKHDHPICTHSTSKTIIKIWKSWATMSDRASALNSYTWSI